MGQKLHVITLLLVKDHPIQFLMLTGRVPNRNCIQEYITDALYCNDECDLDCFLVQEHIGGGGSHYCELSMFQWMKRKEI